MASSREVLALYRGQVGKQAERKEWLVIGGQQVSTTDLLSASKARCSQGKFPITDEKSQVMEVISFTAPYKLRSTC